MLEPFHQFFVDMSRTTRKFGPHFPYYQIQIVSHPGWQLHRGQYFIWLYASLDKWMFVTNDYYYSDWRVQNV